MFDAEIAAALGDINAAVIVQQLNYWMNKDSVGTIINGTKYVYNTFVEWVNQQFPWLSVWQFRKAMSLLRSLGIVKVVRHKAKQWNQTNYYSLDSDRLVEFLNSQTAVTTKISELCNNSPQDNKSQPLKVSDTNISLYESKSTTKKVTAKQNYGDRPTSKISSIAAARPKEAVEKENSPKQELDYSAELKTAPGQIKQELKVKQLNTDKNTNVAQVDYIVNKRWKKLIPLLDDAGIPINKTITSLLKLYPKEEVESAIALLRVRKRDAHIPNIAGYFVAALKQDWASKNLAQEVESDRDLEIDKATVFRHWYDLARELGYCSGQEVKDGEQWICLSGTWEKWSDALGRGYSLNYLKKIVKRNGGR